MKPLKQRYKDTINVEHVSVFYVQAPPEFCFSKLTNERIRRRAHQDVLEVEMEPEVGGVFRITYEKPAGPETIQMKITEYAPPSLLETTVSTEEEDLTHTYRLKRVEAGTRLTVITQRTKKRNWLNGILYTLFKRRMDQKVNHYWKRLAVEIEKEFQERHLFS
ncbi:SRPBCC domain-containing protein [Thermoactinomyces intermedius]|jgi:uncharacterized protein YndB with AHSA1/START domain|uniref:SRPBCC domain-containing protein n=1 Tax=Thermoactinomyces intermedius TaxID=2024 RepID=A0A8I1A3E9_THEIN|nr:MULTISPECIES: SRPBCC domain-containing protein [Thermoactinomyces]MBA4549508.1 SRPBCC domain-containing protein [Thermoactinomyces intermedius]MBA4836941.1 SRPBCC domain-containing protein [Thermoactinomyces intermedius]MBH8594872.1 SRPBCC domain-containing protein [Thermoactinomyces intermedius]MBH8602353.1 SRPBCC domain-containing protein [Thermoactinomyces sp. CICC 23799]